MTDTEDCSAAQEEKQQENYQEEVKESGIDMTAEWMTDTYDDDTMGDTFKFSSKKERDAFLEGVEYGTRRHCYEVRAVGNLKAQIKYRETLEQMLSR